MTSRFTLLDVEDGEEYLEDFAAFYYPALESDAAAMRRRLKGRLRLCTRSLVFEPDDVKLPLIRLPFRDVDVLARADVGLSSPLASLDLCKVVSKITIYMKENGVVAPYIFDKALLLLHLHH